MSTVHVSGSSFPLIPSKLLSWDIIALKKKMRSKVMLIVLLNCCMVGVLASSDTPKLSTKNANLSIASNHTLNITCRGEQPVFWSWPGPVDNRVSLSVCNESIYCQILVVSQFTVNDTGIYKCYYEGSHTPSQVHVSIVDQSSPFVSSASEKPIAVYIPGGAATVNDTVIIPCFASREDLNVTLRTKYAENMFAPNGHNIQWDYTKGIIISSGLLRVYDMVFCETTVNGQKYRSSDYIIVVIEFKIFSLSMSPHPQIQVAVGEKLALSCSAHTPFNVRVQFKWDFPSMEDKRATQTISRNISHNFLEYTGQLSIEKATLEDEGYYSCTADTGGMNRTNITKVIVHEKPFILIDEEMEKVIVCKNGDHIKIPVKFTAYPAPEVKWMKNGIPTRHRFPYLSINHCDEDDIGNYTVILTNPKTRDYESHTFQVFVHVPPHIGEKSVSSTLESYKYGKQSSLTCTAYGIPTPVSIQWSWQLEEECTYLPQLYNAGKNPYSCSKWRDINDQFGGNIIEAQDIRRDIIEGKVKTVSRLLISAANVSAVYKCTATNKAGRDEHIIPFHVTRGLDVSMHPRGRLTERVNVTLKCIADKFTYENLMWFKRKSPGARSWSMHTCGTVTNLIKLNHAIVDINGEYLTSELTLRNISLDDQGHYDCVALEKKTLRKRCFTTELTIHAQKRPIIHHELKNQTTNVSETLEVRCLATGLPDPQILWFKNSDALVGDSGIILKDHNRTLTIQRVRKQDEGFYSCRACNELGCAEAEMFFTVNGNYA